MREEEGEKREREQGVQGRSRKNERKGYEGLHSCPRSKLLLDQVVRTPQSGLTVLSESSRDHGT